MRISDATIEALLKTAGKLSDEQLATLKEEEKTTNRPLQELVVRREIVNEKDLIKLYAEHQHLPYIDLDKDHLSKEIISTLPERIARQYSAVVFKIDEDGAKHVAMEDPDDVQAVDFIQKYIGTNTRLYFTTKQSISDALDLYRGDVAKELNEAIEVQQESDITTEQQVSDEDIAEDSPIAQTVNLLLEYAIRSGASDVHIEPREDYVSVRYRIDGILHEANKLPKNVQNSLVSRIKILSNLKIDEHRAPQDGRFKISLNDHRYAFRVSTLPIIAGEKVAMRILDESSTAQTLEDLGCWGHALDSIKTTMVEPNGMILVTGPTGSGKSTTLFSILSELNKPTINISTVEDPIEYRIEGANQTQVNPQAGMTFANGLRALLRQDPNIIMVGEIRDSETANLGVQAALTGHLVFTTLHTNNAATSLPRLLDMGIEPFLIASTVRMVAGQRLVRQLCTYCREKYSPSAEEFSSLMHIFGIKTPEQVKTIHLLEQQAVKQGVGKDIGNDLSSTETSFNFIYKEHPGGCTECNNTGYKGRSGIYEAVINSPAIQRLIVGNATSDVIQNQAISEGTVTMQLDGLIKALRGVTSIEEVLRVTRE